jgi:hypothetical protein
MFAACQETALEAFLDIDYVTIFTIGKKGMP